ncbi:MAG: TRAP transporter small permease [Rhizobiaceae bacterium]
MRAFERIISRVAFVVDGAAGIFLAIITALTFTAVLMRYVFNLPFPGSFDVSRLLLGVAIFWGIAAASWRGEHIQVDILWQFLPVRAQRALDLFADIVFCVFVAGITWMLYWQVWRVQASRQTTFEMSIPVWPFYGIAWLGIAFCTLVLLARILRAIVNFNAPIPESTAAES